MKVLMIGDASNYHANLAKGLRKSGHTVVVASASDCADIVLRRETRFASLPGYVLDVCKAMPAMCGYDVVYMVMPGFVAFRPMLIRLIFDYLCRHNRRVYMSAVGCDPVYYKACVSGDVFRYSEYRIGDLPSAYMKSAESHGVDGWTGTSLVKLHNHQLAQSAGVVTCLYEYHKAYEQTRGDVNIAYGGIPIDVEQIAPRVMTETSRRLKFLLCRSQGRHVLKGSDVLLDAVRRLCDAYPEECEYSIAENLPYADFLRMLAESDVVLDQIYSYTPATTALLAMAHGRIAVSGGEEEFYEFIGEKSLRPVVNVDPLQPDDAYNRLEWLLCNRNVLPSLSAQGVEFVSKHNGCDVVAKRHEEIWVK